MRFFYKISISINQVRILLDFNNDLPIVKFKCIPILFLILGTTSFKAWSYQGVFTSKDAELAIPSFIHFNIVKFVLLLMQRSSQEKNNFFKHNLNILSINK